MHINSSDDQATSDINLEGYIMTSTSRGKSTEYNRRRLAIVLVYLRLPGGSTVMFRCYLLGGDTVSPSGLYARVCQAFLVAIYSVSLGKQLMRVF